MDGTGAFQIGLRAAIWCLNFCQVPRVQQVWLETLKCKKRYFFSMNSVSLVLKYLNHTDGASEGVHFNANYNHLNLKCHLQISF